MSEEYRVRRRGAVVLANSTVYDESISYTALGILAILLARPDDAPKGYRTLMRPGCGQRSILAAFAELRKAGYRYQFYKTAAGADGRNRVTTCTYIYEEPVSLDMAKKDHFEETGCAPIEVTGRKQAKDDPSSKGSLASVCDAHTCDAHTCDAHTCVAQRPGVAAVGFSPSNEEINQRAGEATTPPAAVGAQADANAGHAVQDNASSQPPQAPQDGPAGVQAPQGADEGATAPQTGAQRPEPKLYGITPQQAATNTRGAALARAALRGERIAV